MKVAHLFEILPASVGSIYIFVIESFDYFTIRVLYLKKVSGIAFNAYLNSKRNDNFSNTH